MDERVADGVVVDAPGQHDSFLGVGQFGSQCGRQRGPVQGAQEARELVLGQFAFRAGSRLRAGRGRGQRGVEQGTRDDGAAGQGGVQGGPGGVGADVQAVEAVGDREDPGGQQQCDDNDDESGGHASLTRRGSAAMAVS